MPDRDEIEKLVVELGVAFRKGAELKKELPFSEMPKTTQQGYVTEARHVLANFVPRSEHEETVASARDHIADLEQTIDDLREQVKELS